MAAIPALALQLEFDLGQHHIDLPVPLSRHGSYLAAGFFRRLLIRPPRELPHQPEYLSTLYTSLLKSFSMTSTSALSPVSSSDQRLNRDWQTHCLSKWWLSDRLATAAFAAQEAPQSALRLFGLQLELLLLYHEGKHLLLPAVICLWGYSVFATPPLYGQSALPTICDLLTPFQQPLPFP